MTDAIATERERPEDSPSVPIEPASPPADDLDRLLQEFDAQTAQTEPATTLPDGNASPDPLDALLAEYNKPSEDQLRVQELTQQVDGLQLQAHRQQELEAFNKFADDLQTQMPSWAPPDYARLRLESLAHDPELALAWDLRGVDKSAANLELAKVQQALIQLQQNPASDPKRVKELQQYGYRLQVAVNSAAILRKARLNILNEANKLPKPIDEDQTAWRTEIAASMRGASMPVDFKEPPPDFSGMSDAEFREYTRKNYGF